ncbi:MAG: M55 family metallopeptidase [Pirellulales bacterium]|nr:M55 family metallopeptidase [Pirellulales bacterium]
MLQKKYMIRCDIEGVSGVVSYTQAEPGKAEYEFGRRMFKADLMAVIEGLMSGGAEEIVVYDEHYYGRNIDPAWLPRGVTAICGKPPYRADWPGGLDETFDGVVLLGFHSKAETPGGLLPHTYELDIRDLRLNGISVGEIGMEAAIAGDLDVATLLVVADSAGAAEAKALLPGVSVVAVKEAHGESGASCYPLSETTACVRVASEEIVINPPRVRPYRVETPVEFEVELNEGPYLDSFRRLNADDMRDERTFLISANSATAAWADYWQRKLRAQSEMEQDS